jgi:hypothetical protein
VDEPIIDPAAEEQVLEVEPDDGRRMASYWRDGRKVGHRFWCDGRVGMEYRIEDDVMHGPFRMYHDNGRVSEVSTYVNGLEHGVTRQFDEEGVLLGTYELDHGCGLDLWYMAVGVLAEERRLEKGHRHGFERWWSGDNATIYIEGHFFDSQEHGIFRRWNDRQHLRRGFPKYFILGQKVQRRAYDRACRSDPTLPKYDPDDNRPNRTLPSGL